MPAGYRHYQFNEKQLELADEKIRQLIRLVDGLHADDMHDLMFVYELKRKTYGMPFGYSTSGSQKRNKMAQLCRESGSS